MIQRLYIENFRCFEILEIDFSNKRSALVLGKNGAGKSTLLEVFKILQRVGRGVNRVEELIKIEEPFSPVTRMQFDISIQIDVKRYDYSLSLERGMHTWQVQEERLLVDGEVAFSRESFQVDASNVALPLLALAPVKAFRLWLSQMVILAPVPSLMTGYSDKDTSELAVDCGNFGSWLGNFLKKYPKSSLVIDEFILGVFPDFGQIELCPAGEDGTDIYVQFGGGNDWKSIHFKNLSDGEKVAFLCAVVVAVNRFDGPLFCFWDEPDNFLSLSEVGHVIMALRRSFEASGQFLVTSHNPEAIRKFSDENTLYLDRKSHLDPPTARWLSELKYNGDLVESLVRGDITNDGK